MCFYGYSYDFFIIMMMTFGSLLKIVIHCIFAIFISSYFIPNGFYCYEFVVVNKLIDDANALAWRSLDNMAY